MSEQRTHQVKIIKQDDDLRVVYGEVYAPNTLDSHGEFMLPADVAAMAHRFLKEADLSKAIDTNHDNVPNGSYPVESYIARAGDPDFAEGAWVLGVKIVDDRLWKQVKRGNISAYSFEAMVRPVEMDVDVSVIRDHVGQTEAGYGHTHLYFLQLDEMGRVVKGWTDTVDGHRHTIATGCRTNAVKGHAHRVFL